VTAGQINECVEAVALLASVRIGTRRRPRLVLGDRAYSTRAIRRWARAHHVRLLVPERRDQLAWRARHGRRACTFDAALYRARNVVERAVGWLKRWRRVATRAEKLAVTYRAAICIVLTARYAARYFSDTT
jgi:transposase